MPATGTNAPGGGMGAACGPNTANRLDVTYPQESGRSRIARPHSGPEGYGRATLFIQAAPAGDAFPDTPACDTRAYLRSDPATVNHLPCGRWSPTLSGGDYANPAEIGLYALSRLAAYDLGRPWSPSWAETSAEITAIPDRLCARRTGARACRLHGPNAYNNSVFYSGTGFRGTHRWWARTWATISWSPRWITPGGRPARSPSASMPGARPHDAAQKADAIPAAMKIE